MARTISWIPRLPEIRRRVRESVRSHYSRSQLEDLFEVQPSTASTYLEILPVTKVGTSYVVDRKDLMVFLDRANEADDMPALFKKMKEEKAGVSRKALRYLVQRDYDPMTLYGIPDTLKLSRGHLEIDFPDGVESLGATLVLLARVLTDDLDEFVRLYAPRPQGARRTAMRPRLGNCLRTWKKWKPSVSGRTQPYIGSPVSKSIGVVIIDRSQKVEISLRSAANSIGPEG